ncbi:MAG TPA: hypothetical protein VHZ78_00680 [Rhizomicrobium sp.]|nr:hypothetical protein [Rhizomicrobium sp.]
MLESDRDTDRHLMRKGTLARFELYLGAAIFVAVLALAGYGLVAALADRLDPKVRDCVERTQRSAGKPVTRDYAVALCKRLEAVGAL